jgi:hypothetical protein
MRLRRVFVTAYDVSYIHVHTPVRRYARRSTLFSTSDVCTLHDVVRMFSASPRRYVAALLYGRRYMRSRHACVAPGTLITPFKHEESRHEDKPRGDSRREHTAHANATKTNHTMPRRDEPSHKTRCRHGND